MYLANRGYRVANYALVPHVSFPLKYVEGKTSLFIVGLTTDTKRLLQVRRNRLQHLSDNSNESYADFDSINDELTTARKLFSSQGWPVLDVSRRSVEETGRSHYSSPFTLDRRTDPKECRIRKLTQTYNL
jgi:regulator of PEP synthase PpsR (kinase-PPPase family)